MKTLIAALSLALLTACGAPSLEQPKLSDKDLNLEEYFVGRSVAYGQFQDVLGRIQRRFKVEITGTWDGEVLVLDERFTYSDGSKETRIWTLAKTGPDTWSGTADGVQGVAVGQENGDTFNWRYTIDLPKADGSGTIRVSFDDWMWLLEDGRLLNRAYMRQSGIHVGEATIFFEKK
ncbi:DUF3833 domain-containing protein [Shimia abyssi]|uniref:Uncharacterized protein DUF3833 n=1 Tax=Shimia abyssi TaxID=1662395 RepID=A0A2P8FGZ2_9RHOB|nr:DUF3833 domain-containing protein [Shimia abyssi]PSL20968.1 uncharacterized protein DUF3833 [Shimia abyssi]